MLRTLLIATTLLTASNAALAHDGQDYGRVISVEPHFSISFGTRHHDGFRVLYESGGQHYWTHTSHHPGHYFVLPPQHFVLDILCSRVTATVNRAGVDMTGITGEATARTGETIATIAAIAARTVATTGTK
jgi:hypothetical protein